MLLAAALSNRHPMFRGGFAFSLGEPGGRPGRIVLWKQLHQTRPVVVGWAAITWDEPAAGQVTIERIAWPPTGSEEEARQALTAATGLVDAGARP